MSFLSFAEKCRMFVQTVNENRERESLIIGKETVALVRLRVQNEGVDSNGQSFGGYSKAVVPQYYYYGRSLSDGAEDKVKAGDWFLSYEEFREDNNLRTDIKDFTFSGEMWSNAGVTDIQSDQYKTDITLGGQTQRSAELLSYHSDKYGNLLAPNEQEITFIVDSHIERINQAIKNVF